MDGATVARVDKKQSGSAAIEFAFVLPLLIALTYSTLVYSYVFVVYESINYAAQQGAEAAVAVNPDLGDGYEAAVVTYAQSTVAGALSWLPGRQRDAAVGAAGSAVSTVFCDPTGGGGTNCPPNATGGTPFVVKITFPLADLGLFPVLRFPGIGSVPPLPNSLVGVGVSLLSGGA